MTKRLPPALACGLLAATVTLAANPVDGKWKGTAETPRGPVELTFDLRAGEGGGLTGTVTTPREQTTIEEGRVDADAVSFKQKVSFQGRDFVLVYHGTVKGDEIHFTRQLEGRERQVEFTATRVP